MAQAYVLGGALASPPPPLSLYSPVFACELRKIPLVESSLVPTKPVWRFECWLLRLLECPLRSACLIWNPRKLLILCCPSAAVVAA